MMTWYDDAMRTIIDMPGDQLEALDAYCTRENISRAEAVRRAVARYLEEQRAPDAQRAYGIWRDRPVDALAHEAAMRDEWTPSRRAGG